MHPTQLIWITETQKNAGENLPFEKYARDYWYSCSRWSKSSYSLIAYLCMRLFEKDVWNSFAFSNLTYRHIRIFIEDQYFSSIYHILLRIPLTFPCLSPVFKTTNYNWTHLRDVITYFWTQLINSWRHHVSAKTPTSRGRDRVRRVSPVHPPLTAAHRLLQ